MTEVEKMRTAQLADMSVPEMQVRFSRAKKLLARMRMMSTYDEGYRALLEELVPGIPSTSIICPRNRKSRRVQEKCGFRYHHTLKDNPCPLMGDVRTERVSVVTREEYEDAPNPYWHADDAN